MRRAKRLNRNQRRLAPSRRGYDRDWEKLRDAKLAASPLCEILATHKTPRAATDVDHIIPHRGRHKLRMNWQNLQSACDECHSAKTAAGQ